MNKQEKCRENQPERKRGRPSGKNRVPLSMEERRARNAQYEKERRYGAAEAMRLLAEAAGCSPTTPSKLILHTAHELLARHAELERDGMKEDVEVLRQTNEAIIAEIADLENFLARAVQGKKVKKGKKKGAKHSLGLNNVSTSHGQKITKTKTSSREMSRNRSQTGEKKIQHTSSETIVKDELHTESVPQPLPNLPLYDDWAYDPGSWTLHDPLTGVPIKLERDFSMEKMTVEKDTSAIQVPKLRETVDGQSPVELDSFLCTLNDAEKTLLTDVIEEIDVSVISNRTEYT